jgi:hypothetical protein
MAMLMSSAEWVVSSSIVLSMIACSERRGGRPRGRFTRSGAVPGAEVSADLAFDMAGPLVLYSADIINKTSH